MSGKDFSVQFDAATGELAQFTVNGKPLFKTPMARYGYNGGYNVDYDDGSNCIDWSLGVTRRFAEHYSLSGSVNYSQAVSYTQLVLMAPWPLLP